MAALKMSLLFILFFIIIIANVSNALNNRTLPVKVGVVIDMNTPFGKMGLKCIEMALSDFYASNSHYESRLVLHTRDSRNDVVGAAFAALDLLKNVQVHAIIGPLSSSQASFIISLGGKAHVPIITFSATSPSLASIRSPYFIRATLSDSSQVEAITSIVQAFGWREVVPVYVDNEFGQGMIPFLTDALEQINTRVPYRSVVSPSATDVQITAELYKLMTMQTRVFVVHMLTSLGARFFSKAKELGMMSKDYAWIVTDGMASELSSLDHSATQSMLGVIGVRPYVPDSPELRKFAHQYKRGKRHNSLDLNIFGLWAYDSAVALARAVENTASTTNTFTTSTVNSTNDEDLGLSRAGTKVARALRNQSFKGLAGNFSLVDGQLRSPPYEIINLVGDQGAQVVGYWTKENGIVRDLSQTNSNKHDAKTAAGSNLGSIIWPGDTKDPPKGWVIPTNGKKLRIGVPVKFSEFLRVTWNSDNTTQVEGYCIDVFEAVIGKLRYGVQYEYIPFANSNHEIAGTYNDLIYQVYLGNFDAIVGDVTIVANRSQYVDFTLPYTQSEVYIVVPNKDETNNQWAFLKPLTWQLWLTSFGSFIIMGLLVWILEHRINDEFRGSVYNQVGMIFWFGFSTMVFTQKESIKSNWTRSVLILWFLLVLILTQSYTASLSSLLTVRQLQPTVRDVNDLLKSDRYVGYRKGSFVFELLKNIGFPESRLLAFLTDELDEILSDGIVAAVFDEIPYMKLFLAKHGTKYTTINPTYKNDGFAFVFPIGSPLVSDVSRAILSATEGNQMAEIERKWFGDKSTYQDSNSLNTPNSLGLECFWGLFAIVGGYSLLVFIIYMVTFLRKNFNGRFDGRLLEIFLEKEPDENQGPVEPAPEHHQLELVGLNQNMNGEEVNAGPEQGGPANHPPGGLEPPQDGLVINPNQDDVNIGEHIGQREPVNQQDHHRWRIGPGRSSQWRGTGVDIRSGLGVRHRAVAG